MKYKLLSIAAMPHTYKVFAVIQISDFKSLKNNI